MHILLIYLSLLITYCNVRMQDLPTVYILFIRLISCRHFFDVWRHSFDVVQFICERGLYSEEGNLVCVRWYSILGIILVSNSLQKMTEKYEMNEYMQRIMKTPSDSSPSKLYGSSTFKEIYPSFVPSLHGICISSRLQIVQAGQQEQNK